MVRKREPASGGQDAGEQEMRDREVLRANRELAAYFKGQRTEREARAALKTIKAFVRDRERQDAKQRRPLPGAAVAAAAPDQKRRAPRAAAAKRVGRARPRTVRESARPASNLPDDLHAATRDAPE